jgi:hypothetical protein
MPDLDEVNSRILEIEKSLSKIEKILPLIEYKVSSLVSGVKWFGGTILLLIITDVAMRLKNLK